MQSVILVSWEIVECCLREPNFSGGRIWFWWIKEFSLWVTTRSISLLTELKRLMGLWKSGSESGLSGFRMGINLEDFQAQEKYQNLRIWLKSLVRWMRVLRETFRSTVAETPSVPGADVILRDWIRRRSSYGFVSWAWVTYGWGRRKYLLTVRFAVRAWLAVPTFRLR
jgi:hypothetical protein